MTGRNGILYFYNMKKNRFLATICCLVFLSVSVFAQNVAINTTGAAGNASAMLDVDAPNMGLLVPRVALTMTTVAAPVVAPVNSLLVFNTATVGDVTPGYYYWSTPATAWVRLNSGAISVGWLTTGNAGTAPGVNFLGTTDNQSLVVRTNNTERMRVLNTGNVGINQIAPIQTLDVNGRINVANGVIQKAAGAIVGTNDLGLYSQPFGNWIRLAANWGPIKFFTDQGGGVGAGTNAIAGMFADNGGGMVVAAENTGTGNAGIPNSRSALEINSTTKGLLVPRLTSAQRDAMTPAVNAAAEGLLIYNTDLNCFEFWDTQSTPFAPATGFWNSLCDHCDQVVVISANQTGYNLATAIGTPTAKTYCVYVMVGNTLQAAGNGGAPGTAGNPGFNASTMPAGAKVILYNYGTILAGGGNGGQGASESDAVCLADNNGQNGGAGGPAILTNAGVQVKVFNSGTIRGGGGGGGGGQGGCCSAGGGGGGGAGTPIGTGGTNNCYNCGSGGGCPCGGRIGCSTAGANGTAVAGGAGGVNAGSIAAAGCSANNNGGNGGAGGALGVAGANGAGGACPCGTGCVMGIGGITGYSVNGNGSGSSLTNIGAGISSGPVNP